jgi:hypothetical protein
LEKLFKGGRAGFLQKTKIVVCDVGIVVLLSGRSLASVNGHTTLATPVLV